MKNIVRMSAVAATAALALAACSAAPSATPSASNTAPAAPAYKACMVSDSGGFDDKSFNQSGYEGLLKAQTDLGIAVEKAESNDAASLAGVTPFAGRVYVPTRHELLERYSTDTDRDLEHVKYYCVLGLFKLACVMEGSFARFRAGTSDDAYFASLAQGVPALARRALEFAHGDLL